MKKIYLLSLAVVLAFASCSKEDNPTTQNDPVDNTPKIPTEFTKKVLVEEFSGAWCGWCPDGAYRLEQLMDQYPDQVVGVTLHYGDAMQISNYNDIKTKFGVSGYPSGMVDRRPSKEDSKIAMSRSLWMSNTVERMKEVAKTGLKIDATDKENITVTAAFNDEIQGDIRLSVYVIEDEVVGSGTGYNQHNYLSQRAGYENNPYYNEPSVILGYKHMQVWRKVLSDETFGDQISSDDIKAGGTFEKTFSLKTDSWDDTKVSIIAFVNIVGPTGNTHEVLNVQKVKLGSAQDWD